MFVKRVVQKKSFVVEPELFDPRYEEVREPREGGPRNHHLIYSFYPGRNGAARILEGAFFEEQSFAVDELEENRVGRHVGERIFLYENLGYVPNGYPFQRAQPS